MRSFCDVVDPKDVEKKKKKQKLSSKMTTKEYLVMTFQNVDHNYVKWVGDGT